MDPMTCNIWINERLETGCQKFRMTAQYDSAMELGRMSPRPIYVDDLLEVDLLVAENEGPDVLSWERIPGIGAHIAFRAEDQQEKSASLRVATFDGIVTSISATCHAPGIGPHYVSLQARGRMDYEKRQLAVSAS